MKRTNLIIILVFSLVVLLLTSCTKGVTDKDQGTNEEPKQGITVNQTEYEVVEINTIDEQLSNDIEQLKQTRGYEYWEQEDGSYLILISAGEKPTGGYEIEVKSVEDNEGQTIISVMEIEPGANDVVTLAITYPFVIIKVNGVTDQFIIYDQRQSEYEKIGGLGNIQEGDSSAAGGTMLNADENPIDFSKPIVGVYQGRIDNNSIELAVGEMPVALFSYELDQYLEGIEEGDSIEVTVSVSPSDQLIVEDIIKLEQ